MADNHTNHQPFLTLLVSDSEKGAAKRVTLPMIPNTVIAANVVIRIGDNDTFTLEVETGLDGGGK